MKLNGLLETGATLPAFRELLAGLEAGQAPGAPLAIYHAARPYLAALLARGLNRPLLLLTARSGRARQWVDELRSWLPDEAPVLFLADPDALPYERIAWTSETRQRRLEALGSLAMEPDNNAGSATAPARPATAPYAPVVVASARALMQMTLPVREMRASLRPVRRGQRFDLNKVLASWVGLGYDSAPVVEAPGQFSRRGGIIDVWPPNLRRPVRLELFGDEVDSLRSFDPSTQRTSAQIEQTWIGPASEALPKLGEFALERLDKLDLSPCHPPARMEYEREREQLAEGTGFRNLEWYIPYLYSQPASILDYLPAGGWLLLDDAAELMGTLADLGGQAEQLSKDLLTAGDVPGGMVAPYFGVDVLREKITARPSLLLGSTTMAGWAARVEDQDAPAAQLARAFTAGPRYGGQVRKVTSDLENSLAAGAQVVMVSRQAGRLAEILAEAGHRVTPVEDLPTLPVEVAVVQGVMEEGWLLRRNGTGTDLWFLTDAELFGWGKPRPRRAQQSRAIAPEVFFADIKPGDYVVHMEHGIGQFQGLVQMAFEGVQREYLQLEYAQGDKLYVPVHQADRLARYVGAGEVLPGLHRLGTADWEQVKARTKKAVAEIADELLELYARREVVQGHAFSPDAPWQAELEASFPYSETEDQLVAIEAVKHDMEQPQPMDRLICGDVGYGKTEVALRAAFKAIMDGKQVAVLVPTTVLAQQHFTNFTRRMAAFPVRVAMLSRFETPAQQTKALEGLASGSIDLVVGTHRLLSKDVIFKDLGLLIVDEEQRFGVTHKERIKQMRTEVDVLTLTATPIPRTLHMSLTGVRDLSTIDTPPEERLPIKTLVAEFDETMIRQAILREVDRNGQVYFVHNRVQGIEQMAARLQKLVPEVRIVIGHGQMAEKELSSVMLKFAEGEYDVLVCTSIIESGLDIPNVNTIIINRADQFGLAQLYQLRGRVGRSAVRAYAYLVVDKYKTLTHDARRRLEAIEEASDLGAGFRIAMQDLEIRGAGELLGARQHGHIAAVGFDLYTRILAQAVKESRERAKAAAVAQQAASARLAAVAQPPSGDGQEDGMQAEEAPAGAPETEALSAPAATGTPVANGATATARRRENFPRHASVADPMTPAVTLELNIPAALPEEYVPETALRLQLYRRLAGLTSLGAVDEIRQEFIDRFGPLPVEVENLLFVVRIKVMALAAGVEAVSQEEGQLVIKSAHLENVGAGLAEQLRNQGIPARLARRAIWLPMRENDQWRRDLAVVLQGIR
jgi:transcription-repair coupling factor (superfamily II helicase)